MAHRAWPRGASRRKAVAQAALLLLAGPAMAQTDAVQTVTVTGRNAADAATVAGFGEVPLAQAPFSATVINIGQLRDAGITGIGDLTRLDASTTDAYNAPGYWGELAVRGYTLDNRFNYRRDGLPINAETVIAQGNKQAMEILKGTSGVQAGISAPGGLVNLIVKRPLDDINTVTVGWEQNGSLTTAIDVGRRNGGFGWRVNAGADRLDPMIRDSRGYRDLLAGAAEAQLGAGALLEAEIEWSRQSQPSTPGFSLLGNRLPDARSIDPTINLNDQPWRLPVVMDGLTGSLRYTQALNADTRFVAHVMRQQLHTDDRIAFPFGCSAENNFNSYCSNGSFDLYDYRSNGERRNSDALDLSVDGRATLLGLAHRYEVGVMETRFTERLHPYAYNLVGTGTIDGSTILPSDPTPTLQNTDRDERSTEWHLQDIVTLAPRWTLWAGARYSRLRRESVLTDGTQATRYDQNFVTPWLALSHALSAQDQVYLSWGQGVETDVTPNLPMYTNAGQPLPALKSRQTEVGFKHNSATLGWDLSAFDIHEPAWRDIGSCDNNPGTCTEQIDGEEHHRGIEALIDWRHGAWNLRTSAMLLQARREGSADPTLNGLRPTNVPSNSVKAQAAYNVAAVPGLALLGFVTHEGQRMVLPDNSVATPGWTRIDLGARLTQRLRSQTLVWRLGIDNIADHRAWKEAPYQYDHAYLYPLAPRTARASVQISF